MRRLSIVALVVGLVAGLAIGLRYVARIASVGVAYKARLACSGVFVSRRAPQSVLAELEQDDLAILRRVGVVIDPVARSVTATVLGVVKRRAVYREGLGCALVENGALPPAMPAPTFMSASAAPVSRPIATPLLTSTDNRTGEQLRAAIERAFAEPNPLRPRRTRAVVIVRKGRIVAERYAAGIGPDTPLIGWSMTKSVMSALAGVLVGDGRLALDEPLPMPEWQTPGDPRARITLDQLLRMSSGLRFDEDMSNPAHDVMQMLLGVGDMASYAAAKPLEAPPGARWQYSSGTSNIIARIVRNVLNDDREYFTFPRRALFDRLGMTGAVLETDTAGTFVGSSFMYATARDWARFGMLYLRDGVWNGERILPAGWVRYTRTAAPADPRRHYGAGFWLDVPDEYRSAGITLPADAFHAAGHEGQFVTIVPSRDTVIVRLGRTRYPEAWDQAAFVRDVIGILDASAPGDVTGPR